MSTKKSNEFVYQAENSQAHGQFISKHVGSLNVEMYMDVFKKQLENPQNGW